MLLLPWPALPLFWGSSLFLKGSTQTTGNHHSQLRELEGTHLRRDARGLSARGPHSEKAEYFTHDPKSTAASRFLRADGLLLIHGKDGEITVLQLPLNHDDVNKLTRGCFP